MTALCPSPTATGFQKVAAIERTSLLTILRPTSSARVAQVGYEAMKRGKRVVVPRIANRPLAESVRFPDLTLQLLEDSGIASSSPLDKRRSAATTS